MSRPTLIQQQWLPCFISYENVPAELCVKNKPGWENRFLLARDVNENGKKEFLLLSERPTTIFREIERAPPEHRVFYEYVHGPQKMHVDLDISLTLFPELIPGNDFENQDERLEEEKANKFEEISETILRATIDALLALVYPLRDLTGCSSFSIGAEENVVVCSSHRQGKKSWHILLNGFYLASHEEAKMLFGDENKGLFSNILKHPNIKSLLRGEVLTIEKLKKCVDGSVYKSMQQWRMLHCHKKGVNNCKQLVNKFCVTDIEMGIIREVQTHWREWDTLVGLYPRNSTNALIFKFANRVQNSVQNPEFRRTKSNTSSDYFRALLDLIPKEKWEAYESWFCLIGAMWNFYEMNADSCDEESEDFQILEFYSKKAPEKYDEQGLLEKMRYFTQNPPRVGWTFVKELAREMSPTGFRAVSDRFAAKALSVEKAYEAFSRQDGFYYENLIMSEDGYGARVAEPGPGLLRQCQRVIAALDIAGSKKWVIKSKDGIVRRSKLGSGLIIKQKNEESGRRGRRPVIPLDVFLQENYDSLALFNKMDFIPYNNPGAVPHTTLNLFNGFEALKTPSPSFEEINQILQPLLDHLRNIWCCGEEEHFEYLLRWFAWIFQKPEKKTGVLIVIHSTDQGVGKSAILDFIMEKVIGKNYCWETNDWNALLGPFNGPLLNKILTVCDELSAEDMAKTRVNINKLKNMVTTNTFTLNEKGENQITGIQDHNNYIISTNSEFSTIVEATDRRTFCLSASCSRANNTDYFSNLNRCLNNPKAGRAFYDFLMHYPIPEGWIPNNPPITRYKEQQVERSESSAVLFIKEAYMEPELLFDRLTEKIPEYGSTCGSAPVRDIESEVEEEIIRNSGYIRVECFYELYKRFCAKHGITRTLGRNNVIKDVKKRFRIQHIPQLRFAVDPKRKAGIYIDSKLIREDLKKIFPSMEI